MRKKNTIAVTGDVCVDWNIASNRSTDRHNLWKTDEEWASSTSEEGGAWLLAKIVDKLVFDIAYVIKPAMPKKINELTGDDSIDHIYNLCSEFTDVLREKQEKVWRIKKFLGVAKRKKKEPFNKSNLINENGDIDLLIIDDKSLGYRGCKKNIAEPIWLWPDFQKAKKIIIRMARPLCEGKLWEELISNHAHKLIVCFTATDLRHSDVRVSRELSWDQTTIDVKLALESLSSKNLERCQYVMVSFDAVGVLIYSPKQKSWKLIYDANAFEGQVHLSGNGRMAGFTYCLIAAFAYHFSKGNDLFKIDELAKASRVGLIAQKHFFKIGYMLKKDDKSLLFPVDDIKDSIKVLFDFSDNKYKDDPKFEYLKDWTKYSELDLWKNSNNSNEWSILGDYLSNQTTTLCKNQYEDIIKSGPEKHLTGIPIRKFNELIAVERHEIESLHSIRNAIREYDKKRRSINAYQLKPLSIGAFGEPGSGKSFAIKQIAKSLDLKPSPKMLEYNLSQLSDPKDIIKALHQVRDAVLKGSLPFVFWDEFDSTFNSSPFGWLKYFLAPMQDGQFQEGENTHTIGPCVFIFAGGTSASYANFVSDGISNNIKNDSSRSETKKTDFVSRLMGKIDIKGVNYSNDKKAAPADAKIRRAILLRSFLKKHAESIWDIDMKTPNIDKSVIRAFMEISEYKHGARSMEAIIVMSRLSGEMEFTPSALPPISQLDIHVDGNNFMDLISGNSK